jgi:hypothetical protein
MSSGPQAQAGSVNLVATSEQLAGKRQQQKALTNHDVQDMPIESSTQPTKQAAWYPQEADGLQPLLCSIYKCCRASPQRPDNTTSYHCSAAQQLLT